MTSSRPGRRPANRSMRIGAVGLGVGTIAAYGRVGDVIRFYELDPAVARIIEKAAVLPEVIALAN